jgi:hypothetical protein
MPALCSIQGDSLARGPKVSRKCGTQANASHWTSQINRGGPCCFPSFPVRFPSFPVRVYKFSSHYLNNIICYRYYFGASSDRITLYNSFIGHTEVKKLNTHKKLFYSDTISNKMKGLRGRTTCTTFLLLLKYDEYKSAAIEENHLYVERPHN